MHTYYLTEEQVLGYARDLAMRLEAMPDKPFVWCPVGFSGMEIAQRILNAAPQFLPDVLVCPVNWDRKSGDVTFKESDPSKDIAGRRVLVLDSSVHSGQTVAKVVAAITAQDATDVCTYSLVLKAGSCFVPNFFGVLIGEHDRALFSLEKCPNNRLIPYGSIRTLSKEDMARPPLISGVDSIDKFAWADMYYDVEIDPRRRTYVYERHGEILAYISWLTKNGHTVLVDTVAVDKKARGQKIGSHLMRWAETSARHNRIRTVTLWAIEDRVGFYERLCYVQVEGKALQLGKEKYCLMQKALLYHIHEDDEPA